MNDLSILPKITDHHVCLVKSEYGEGEERWKQFTSATLDRLEIEQPALHDVIWRAFSLYKSEEWVGLMLFSIAKMYRMIELASSRSGGFGVGSLPVVSAEIGAPIQRDMFQQKEEYTNRVINQVFHDNLVVVKEIALDTWLYSGEKPSRLILIVCVLLYKMIENQVQVNELGVTTG